MANIMTYPMAHPMITVHHPNDLGEALHSLNHQHPRVLVPTMGALHDGHLTLVRHARKLAGNDGSVILTLFVNPTQFDKAEDLEKYPRTLENDLRLCREHGVDLVFTPESDMYAKDHSVNVTETSLARRLCGASRPKEGRLLYLATVAR